MFLGRRAVVIENSNLRVTMLQEGGHIAEIFDKNTGVNPLWIPPWQSIEPSRYNIREYPQFGSGSDAKLLAGIMGHSSCLDIFGEPSPEEAAAGVTVHGEISVTPYEITETPGKLTSRAHLPLAQLRFERSVELRNRSLKINETVENLTALDRPIGWTQHVSLGPPFLEKGNSRFRASVVRSKVFETDFGVDMHLRRGAEFDWPMAPRSIGDFSDLRIMSDNDVASEFTTHLGDPQREDIFFVAFTPATRLAFGYIWKRKDFPWLGIWQENCSREHSPWDGRTLALGMEFGVSPFPELRRKMVDRCRLFGTPVYRWLPARGHLEVEYWVVLESAESIPESMVWPV
jgi:hypothetical protein